MRLLYLFIRAVDKLSKVVGVASIAMVFIMMVAMMYEVVMRYLFNAPTIWAMELCENMMLLFVPLGGAMVLMEGGHINVDIIYGRLSPRAQAVLNVFTFGVFFAFLYFFFTLSLNQTITATIHQYTSGTIWNPPTWPIMILLTFGVGLLFLEGIVKFIRDLVMAITGSSIERHLGLEEVSHGH